MLSERYYSNDSIWSEVKIVYKVNNAQELNELRQVLEDNGISDYYCIFYPIRKYVDTFNLYQMDCFMENV